MAYRAVLYSMSSLMGESFEDEEILDNTLVLEKKDLKDLRTLLGPRKWRSRILGLIRKRISDEIAASKADQSYPDLWKITRRVLAEQVSQDPSDDLVEEIVTIFNRLTDFKLSDENIGVIRSVYDRNYVQAIISNSIIPSRVYGQKLRDLGVGHYFDTVLCSSDFGVAKPNPEFFFMAQDAMGLTLHDILFVADNLETDVDGAVKAGIPTVLVNRYTRIPELPPNVPLVHKLSDILHYLPSN